MGILHRTVVAVRGMGILPMIVDVVMAVAAFASI